MEERTFLIGYSDRTDASPHMVRRTEVGFHKFSLYDEHVRLRWSDRTYDDKEKWTRERLAYLP